MGAGRDDHETAVELLRAVLALGRRLRARRPRGGVSLSGMSLLGTLARLGPQTAARLAEEEGLQPQSLTRIVAALEREGCIERRRSEADRREIVIALAPAGRDALAAELGARRAWLEQAIAGALTAEERTALRATAVMLARLARHGDGR
jgi:DNA-binding MarR family transcriptional regulator